MQIGIITTARCNAQCRHCSTSCSPHRNESLTDLEIFSLMDEAAALSVNEELKIYFSGGEVFLEFERLLAILKHGRRLGALMTCVTNGFWASTEEKAQRILMAAKSAGLTKLAVSSSRFHEEYISRERVGRVLKAAREVNLPCTLKRVQSKADNSQSCAIGKWAEQAGASIQVIHLMPHLRDGEHLPDSEYVRQKPGLPAGPCPARILTVTETGEAYTCCTPGAFNSMLSLGNVRDDSLEVIRRRFYQGGVQQILRNYGPAYFAAAVEARGLGGHLRSDYIDSCELCTRIGSNPELNAIAKETAEQLEIQQLTTLLQNFVSEKPPAATAGNPSQKE